MQLNLRTIWTKGRKGKLMYIEFEMCLFSLFSEMKIRVGLKFEEIFFLQKSLKHNFPRIASGLAKR